MFTRMKKDMSLGSAQFGIRGYGITNSSDLISDEEIQEILKIASLNDIRYIDSAQAYGDAEIRLGQWVKKEMKMEITSKMHVGGNKKNEQDWEDNLQRSLKQLRTNYLECLMIHNSENLKGNRGRDLMNWLKVVKERGLATKIGISIYERGEIEKINLKEIDVIQVPLSIYDQRIIEGGTLERLKSESIEIHARSIYMQGLVVTKSESWPQWIDKEQLNKHKELEQYCKAQGITLVEAAHQFINSIPELDRYIVGVCNCEQLVELIEARNRKGTICSDKMKALRISDDNLVDPRKWPK